MSTAQTTSNKIVTSKEDTRANIALTAAKIITYPLYNSLIRKGLLITSLYYGSAVMISTMGLTPVLIIGAVGWLL